MDKHQPTYDLVVTHGRTITLRPGEYFFWIYADGTAAGVASYEWACETLAKKNIGGVHICLQREGQYAGKIEDSIAFIQVSAIQGIEIK